MLLKCDMQVAIVLKYINFWKNLTCFLENILLKYYMWPEDGIILKRSQLLQNTPQLEFFVMFL